MVHAIASSFSSFQSPDMLSFFIPFGRAWPFRFPLKSITAVPFVSAALAGCQSDEMTDNVVKDTTLKPPPSLVEETFGRGNAEITLMMAKGPNGFYDSAARDIRDGAAQAIGELDDAGLMKIKVIDIAAGPSAVAPAVAAARGRNSSLIITYAPPATVAALAAIPADQRPMILNLSQPVVAPQVFNFEIDEVESAARGARSVIASGHRKIALLAPSGLSAPNEDRLRRMIAQAGGGISGVVRYDPAAVSLTDLLAANKAIFMDAGAAIIMGEGAGVGLAVKGLRASYPQLTIVGTSSWPQQIYTDPAAANVVIAAFDPDGAGLIGERYNRFNRRALSVYAAYGYDSIAVVAGIVRGKGAAALTPDALTSKTGFRGVTGLFRFAKSGALERKIGLYKIEGGRLSAIEPKPAGF
jgi:ABC-type branched-subunit amino acid transport system substrate-binding protein